MKQESGQVLLNGTPRKLKLFKKISRYIMQNEELDVYSTVRESMMMAAHLKLDSDLSSKDKNDVVSVKLNIYSPRIF